MSAICIVAEIGSGHNGSKERAKELIRSAIDSGADLIKFQHFYADEIIHPRTGSVDLPGGRVQLFQRFRELELSPSFLEYLKASCEQLGGQFFCSPFGLRSANDLLDLGESNFKIASPELNHLPLLSFLAPKSLSMVLSTGISYLADIEEALGCIKREGELGQGSKQLRTNATTGRTSNQPQILPKLSLLHCITAYPAPALEFNLSIIPNLASLFNVPIGLSDHSIDPVLVPALAGLVGAIIIEKHFTLSKNGEGLDDRIASTPNEFASMVSSVRESEKIRRSYLNQNEPNNTTNPKQKLELPTNIDVLHMVESHPSLATLDLALACGLENRNLQRREILSKILGSGVKNLAPSEEQNYGKSNRSIHLLHDKCAGEVLGKQDIAILRSEKNLRPGLHPRHLEFVIGCKLCRPLQAGDGLVWEDLVQREHNLKGNSEITS